MIDSEARILNRYWWYAEIANAVETCLRLGVLYVDVKPKLSSSSSPTMRACGDTKNWSLLLDINSRANTCWSACAEYDFLFINSELLTAGTYRYKHERTYELVQVLIAPISAVSTSSCRAAFRFGSIQWQPVARRFGTVWDHRRIHLLYSATHPRYKRQHTTPSPSASTRSFSKAFTQLPA